MLLLRLAASDLALGAALKERRRCICTWGCGDGLIESDWRRDDSEDTDDTDAFEGTGDGEGEGASVRDLRPPMRGEGVGDGVGSESVRLSGSDSGVSDSGRSVRLVGRWRFGWIANGRTTGISSRTGEFARKEPRSSDGEETFPLSSSSSSSSMRV